MRMEHPYLEEEQVVERYLRGSLTADETARFEEHYLTCQTCLDRLDLVERFDRALKGVAQEEVARSTLTIWARLRRSPWLSPALAVLLLLVAIPGGLGWRTIQRLDGELERTQATLAELQNRHPEAEVNVPILRLSPVRSAVEQNEPVHRLTLPSDLRWIVLSLELEEAEYPRFRVTLVNPEGKVAWQRDDVERDRLGALVLLLPATLFEAGDSQLRVEGLAPGAEPVPLAPFSFRVSP